MIPVEAINRNVAIVGLGGVGTWAAYAAALAANGRPGLIRRLTLLDADRIERRNLARVPFYQYLDAHKVDAVHAALRDWCAFTAAPVRQAVTADNVSVLLQGVDTVICCTDQVESQRFLPIWCKEQDIRYQRAGYDGDTINVCPSIPMTLEPPEVEAADHGYHGVPEVYHAMLAGALAVYSVFNTPVVILGELAKLAVTNSSLVPAPIRDAIAEDAWRTKADEQGWGPGNRPLQDTVWDNFTTVTQLMRDEHTHHEQGAVSPNRNDWCLYCRIGRLEQELAAREEATDGRIAV